VEKDMEKGPKKEIRSREALFTWRGGLTSLGNKEGGRSLGGEACYRTNEWIGDWRILTGEKEERVKARLPRDGEGYSPRSHHSKKVVNWGAMDSGLASCKKSQAAIREGKFANAAAREEERTIRSQIELGLEVATGRCCKGKKPQNKRDLRGKETERQTQPQGVRHIIRF